MGGAQRLQFSVALLLVLLQARVVAKKPLQRVVHRKASPNASRLVSYSNLAGRGPDFSAPRGIRYHQFFQARAGPAKKGVDAVLDAAGGYTPFDAKHNINTLRHLGVVNVKSGTRADLIVRLLNPDGTPHTAEVNEEVHFSIFVTDPRQRVEVFGFEACHVGPHTKLRRENLLLGTGLALTLAPGNPGVPARGLLQRDVNKSLPEANTTSGGIGASVGAPRNNSAPVRLLQRAEVQEEEEEQEHAATFLFRGVSRFLISLAVNGPQVKSGIDFVISGSPYIYNCGAGTQDPGALWSPAKKSWCCRNFGHGCSMLDGMATPGKIKKIQAFDCELGLDDMLHNWTFTKRKWCCRNVGLGCFDPHDCQVGLENWRTGWSDAKIAWCCSHEGVGCNGCENTCRANGTSASCQDWFARAHAALPPNREDICTKAREEVLADCPACSSCSSRAWLRTCSNSDFIARGLSANPNLTDGQEVNHSLSQALGNSSKNGGNATAKAPSRKVNSTEDEADSSPSRAQGNTSNKVRNATAKDEKEWCSQHKNVSCLTKLPSYDCQLGLDEWQTGWSSKKKEWCCKHKHLGCEECEVHCYLDGVSASCTARVDWALQHQFGNGDTACILAHHLVLEQCPGCVECSLEDVCPGVNRSTRGGLVAARAWHPQTTNPAAPTGQTPAQAPPAPPPPPPAPPSPAAELPFPGGPLGPDEQACNGACDSWSHKMKEWCWVVKGVPCAVGGKASDEHDCNVGLANWEVSWTSHKKAWCCEHGDLAVRVHLHEGNGCPVGPGGREVYECEAGSPMAQRNWTEAKTDWCCRHKRIGCRPSTPSRTVVRALARKVSTSSRATTTSFSPTSGPPSLHMEDGPVIEGKPMSYNCSKALAYYNPYAAGPSVDQREWCCHHRKMLCNETSENDWDRLIRAQSEVLRSFAIHTTGNVGEGTRMSVQSILDSVVLFASVAAVLGGCLTAVRARAARRDLGAEKAEETATYSYAPLYQKDVELSAGAE